MGVRILSSYLAVTSFLQTGNVTDVGVLTLPQVFPPQNRENFGSSLSSSQTITGVDDPYDVSIEDVYQRTQTIQMTVEQFNQYVFRVNACLRSFTEEILPLEKNQQEEKI